jgi:hypothetical protein
MLSSKQIVTTDLRSVQPFLNNVARQVRKNSSDMSTDMNTLGKLIDLAKEQILTEYRIESELAAVVEMMQTDGVHQHRQIPVDNPDYVAFINALHHAVLNVRNSEDLVYIKSKYYPIFDAAFVEGTDYTTMILDIGRLEIDAKTVKATRKEISIVPWYKRLFQRFFKDAVRASAERRVDSRGAL